MHLQIDNYDFFIHVKAKKTSIKLKYIKNDIIHLDVPADYPNHELIIFVKKNLHNFLREDHFEAPQQHLKFQIFDRFLDVQFIDELSLAYIQNNSVFLSKNRLKSKNLLSETKETLLLELLNKTISFWEEHHNQLFFDIKLRKLKTNYYGICHNKEVITFSSDLMNRPINFIQYIVAKAVFEQLNLTVQQQEILLQNHVSDWKHTERIIQYERNK